MNILLTDLIPILIINNTNYDFIFSDNPIVFYNLIYRFKDHSFQWIQSPGLLVFCPISPKQCILLFDPIYYNLECNKNNTIIIQNEEEINKINKLQFHNSLLNIYYGDGKSKSNVNKLSKDFFLKYSKEEELSQIKVVKNWNETNNSLVVSSGKAIPEKLIFDFLVCKKAKQNFPVIRNIHLWNLFYKKIE